MQNQDHQTPATLRRWASMDRQDAKRQARLIWLVVGSAVTLAASSAWHAVFGG